MCAAKRHLELMQVESPRSDDYCRSRTYVFWLSVLYCVVHPGTIAIVAIFYPETFLKEVVFDTVSLEQGHLMMARVRGVAIFCIGFVALLAFLAKSPLLRWGIQVGLLFIVVSFFWDVSNLIWAGEVMQAAKHPIFAAFLLLRPIALLCGFTILKDLNRTRHLEIGFGAKSF